MIASFHFLRQPVSMLRPLALLILMQVCGATWGQIAQGKQDVPLAVGHRADLRRDVAHEQSKVNEDQAKLPKERRLSVEQRAELRRQLREQAPVPGREATAEPGKKP